MSGQVAQLDVLPPGLSTPGAPGWLSLPLPGRGALCSEHRSAQSLRQTGLLL